MECVYCIEQVNVPKITMISKAYRTYLALPQAISMTPLHCLIIPMDHVTSTLELDDDVWSEIRNFMKSLIRMSASQGLSMVFMETNLQNQHALIECIPIPDSYFKDIGAFFKQGILDVAPEWTQHRKIIDTARGFRKSMVKNLKYFHVWFNPDGGMGHVIEDDFDEWFGRGVIGGVLDIDVEKWRKPKACGLNELGKRARSFQSSWDAFDWTKMLE